MLSTLLISKFPADNNLVEIMNVPPPGAISHYSKLSEKTGQVITPSDQRSFSDNSLTKRSYAMIIVWRNELTFSPDI